MVKVSKFWKLTFWGLLALVALIAVLWLEENPLFSKEEKRTFKPALKGTEILLEATQYVVSKDRGESWEKKKRGIWALDPDTGKIRLLIPDGEHPIWEPQHNYFAYRRGSGLHTNGIHLASRSGAYEVVVSCGGYMKGWGPGGSTTDWGWGGYTEGSPLIFPVPLEPVGWAPNEELLLFLGPYTQLVYPQKRKPWDRLPGHELDGVRAFQGIYAAPFTPKKIYSQGLKDLSGLWVTLSWFLDTAGVFPCHHCGNPSVSPDGRYIAFEVFRYAPGVGRLSSKIAIAEIKWMGIGKEGHAELENVRRLTQLPEDLLEVNPHWSPDGKMIAFDVIDPKDATRTPHLIRIDGTGLKGWKLSREDLGRERIRLQDGLTKTEHEDELRVLDWLADGRLVLVQAKPEFIIPLTDRGADTVWVVPQQPIIPSTDRRADMVWVVDLQHRHPPLRIPLLKGGMYGFLTLSPSRRQLAWLGGALARADGSIDTWGIQIFDIPAPEDRERLLIPKFQQDIAYLKHDPRVIPFPPERPKVKVYWEVYWMSW